MHLIVALQIRDLVCRWIRHLFRIASSCYFISFRRMELARVKDNRWEFIPITGPKLPAASGLELARVRANRITIRRCIPRACARLRTLLAALGFRELDEIRQSLARSRAKLSHARSMERGRDAERRAGASSERRERKLIWLASTSKATDEPSLPPPPEAAQVLVRRSIPLFVRPLSTGNPVKGDNTRRHPNIPPRVLCVFPAIASRKHRAVQFL